MKAFQRLPLEPSLRAFLGAVLDLPWPMQCATHIALWVHGYASPVNERTREDVIEIYIPHPRPMRDCVDHRP